MTREEILQWTQTVTPDRFIAEAIDVMNGSTFNDNTVMLQALVTRANSEPELETAMVLLLDTPEALIAIGEGRGKLRAVAQAKLDEKWAKAKAQPNGPTYVTTPR